MDDQLEPKGTPTVVDSLSPRIEFGGTPVTE